MNAKGPRSGRAASRPRRRAGTRGRGGSGIQRASARSSTSGSPVTTAPSPAATARARTPMPAEVPMICGTVARNPNWSPEAQSRALFGPGVPELTKANRTRASRSSHAIGLFDMASVQSAALAASCTFFARQPFWRPSESTPGCRRCPGSARCCMPSFTSMRTRHIRMTRGMCSSSTKGGSGTHLDRHHRGAGGSMVGVFSRAHRPRRATCHESRLPQARAVPRHEPAEREPGRPRGRRAVHRGHLATSSSGRSARATPTCRRCTRG